MGALDRWDAANARQRALLAELQLDAPALVDVVVSSLRQELSKLRRSGASLVATLDATRDLLTQFTPLRHGVVVVDGPDGPVAAGFGDLREASGGDARAALDAPGWPRAVGGRPLERVAVVDADGDEIGGLLFVTPRLLGGTALGDEVAGLLGPELADARRRDAAARAAAVDGLPAAVAATGPWPEPGALAPLAEVVALVPGVLGAGVRARAGEQPWAEAWAGRSSPAAEVVRVADGWAEVELWVTCAEAGLPSAEALAAAAGLLLARVAAAATAERVRDAAERDAGTGLPGRLGAQRVLAEACDRAEREDDAVTLVGVAIDDGPRLRSQGLVERADALLRRAASGMASAYPAATVARVGDDRLVLIAPGLEGPGTQAVAGEVHAAASRAMAVGGLSAHKPTCRVATVAWSTQGPVDVGGNLMVALDDLLPDAPVS